MTINLSVPVTHELKPRITVIGVGGAGGNAVNNMITAHLEGVEFIATNTDAQALAQSLTERQIQLGTTLTQGLGAGARPDIGKAAAEEVLDSITDHLQGTNMVFVTAGMGGGTGTGAAPVIAKIARDQGMLTVGVVTKPFQFEGAQRMRIAEQGIAELQQCVDTLIVIPNQNLFRIANENTTFADAFKMADDVLYSGVRGVTDLMVMPGLINLDFADVRSVMSEMGKAMMGTGEADGDKRALDAAEKAINNPLLDDVSLKGARGVLVNITGGPDMTLYEVDESCNHIRDQVDTDANIIFGSTFDEQLEGRIRVSVVATGIDSDGTPRPIAAPHLQATTISTGPRGPEARHVANLAAQAERSAQMIQTEIPSVPEPTAESEPEAAAAPETEQAHFIPPPAAEPVVPAAPAAVEPVVPQQVEMLPETQMAPPSASETMVAPVAAPAPPREKPSLFERMTLSGRARGEPQPAPAVHRPEPVLETAGAPPAATAIAEPVVQSRAEEDLLEIPTFLRRQHN